MNGFSAAAARATERLLFAEVRDAATRPEQAPDAGVACERVLLLNALGALEAVPQSARTAWVTAIQRFQSDDGAFVIDGLSPAAASSLALLALDALGARPCRPLPSAHVDEQTVTARLHSTDWRDPERTADDLTAWLLALIADGEDHRDRHAVDTVHAILDRLDAQQDPETGLWGSVGAVDLTPSIIATHQLLTVYDYVQRPPVKLSRVVDAVLSIPAIDPADPGRTPSPRALFCMVELLVSIREQFGYRSADVDAWLAPVASAVATLQQADGSFEPAQSAGDGAANSPSPRSRACLEGTRLRLATLACVDPASAHSPAEARWNWPSWPGLGYHRRGGALTDRQRGSVVHWIRSRALAPEQGERPVSDPPVLTVVVPLHNLGRYLPQAIESLFAQTRNDFDIIVVDDGSTDELTRIFVEQYRPARTSVVSQANQGVAAARNHGIGRARGRYICCLDPDDMLRRTYFEEAIARLEDDPHVGFVTGSLHMFDAREVVLTTEPFGIADMLATNKVVQPAVFRRTAWEECGGYYGGFSVQGVEDWDLWLSMLERGFRASVIPEVVWEYRILPNSMSSRMYRAEFWAPLRVELAARHQETFRNHVLTLVEQASFELAGIKSYVADQQQAIRWWKQQADTWHSRFEQMQALTGELRAWNARLEEAREWSDTQAANWQRVAAEHAKALADLQAAHESRIREMERTIEELRGWNGRVEEAREWNAAQAETWQRLSAERDRLIAEQQAWIGELERAKTWHDTRRLRWKRLAQQRRRQLRLSKPELGS